MPFAAKTQTQAFFYPSLLFHRSAFLFSISEALYRLNASPAYLALPLAPPRSLPWHSSSGATLLLAHPKLSPVPVLRTASRRKKNAHPRTVFCFGKSC